MDYIDYIIILIWLLVSPFVVRYYRRNRKVTIKGTSVLLDYYTDGVSMTPVSSGIFGTMRYVAIATMPRFREAGEDSLIYATTLPFSSYVHLVGIPKKSGEVQLHPTGGGSIMEPVELEGDYDDYFSLYAEKGMQEDSRYTLNPKVMEFTVDFCQSFSWEIVDNQLYAVETAGDGIGKAADITSAVVEFVDKIRPAIAKPLTAQELKDLTPYGEEYRSDMKCPVCQSILTKEDNYLVCPNGDGVLLKGVALMQLHAGQLQIPKGLLQSGKTPPKTIICPSCGNQMEEVAYNGGKTIIHSCSHCPYRWLDAGDILA